MSDTNSAQASDAVMHMTVTITRKATGAVETYELVGIPEGSGEITVEPPEPPAQTTEGA